MKLQEMIKESRKKNAKFDFVRVCDFLDGQVYSAMNMVATKEGTGYAGSFANWCMDIGRLTGENPLKCRVLGNLMQRLALDSKHDGSGSYKESDWYKVCTLKQKTYSSDKELYMALREAVGALEDVSDKVASSYTDKDLVALLDD